VDEAPAEHIGKVDAAVAISGARLVYVYGDGQQVEYDPYVAGYKPKYSAPGTTVPEKNYSFLAESHRCAEDTCAAWLHKYPAFYTCKCHSTDKKKRPTMSTQEISSLAQVPFVETTRYHTYKQDEKELLKEGLPFTGNMLQLRAKAEGGLSTVHEDQGSTHDSVVSVRVNPDYNKNQSKRNPSLFNKDCYVLSDTTRHTASYKYMTMCAERDGVVQAVERSKDPELLRAVRERRGIVDMKLSALWA